MRLPYTSANPQPSDESEAAIVERIRARRSPRPLQPLDLTLLHAPAVADGWNSFLGAVRTRTSIPADARELAVSRVAACNGAWYEWAHHAPLAVAAGVPEDVMRDLVGREGELPPAPTIAASWQWAVLRYTDEMTRKVEVQDETFAELRRWFDDKEVVEITATVSPGLDDRRRVGGLLTL
jgi:alkylhydroperoxidase family enzyme